MCRYENTNKKDDLAESFFYDFTCTYFFLLALLVLLVVWLAGRELEPADHTPEGGYPQAERYIHIYILNIHPILQY